MERDLNALVLMVTPNHSGVSGAACRLPDLDVVLINRDEVPGRRHFDLAHELFHILTWDAMPPVHVEEATETGGANRVEQLANTFASALLMPARVVQAAADWRILRGDALIAQLNATADHLEVTSSALMWRLVTLELLAKSTALAVPADAIRNNGHPTGLFAENRAAKRLPLFSRRFVEIVARAVEEGRVSIRKIARLLGISVAISLPRTTSRRLTSCEATVVRWRGPVLVDTNAIIEAWRVDAWRALCGGYTLETVEECVIETQTGYQNRRPEQPINREALLAGLKAVHKVSDAERATALIRDGEISMLDEGEKALWAHALARPDSAAPTRRACASACD